MRWWFRLRKRRSLDQDLEDEIAFHRAMRAHDPDPPPFGNAAQIKEGIRDMWTLGWLEAIVRNLRHGTRVLAKTPAFTATVILTLALGIGANSAVFSAIYAVLLRPLPFPNGDELVKLMQAQQGSPEHYVAPVRLEEWNRLNNTFQAITGYSMEDISETSGELPEKLKRARVAPRFLQVMGVAPALGRDFTVREQRFGGPAAVLISYRLWQRRFGGDANAVGKILRFGALSSEIVGIMPASFQFPHRDVDLWSTIPPDAPFAQSRDHTWYTGIGRLKPGVTLASARDNLSAVQASLGRQYPKPDATISASIAALKDAAVGSVRKSLWLLFASVSVLLLIACANIAALLLSRAAARRQETSIRFSLGASRASVAGQLLTEVLILAVAGALAGLLLAGGTSRLLRLLAKDLPRIEEIGLNATIVLYSLACALVVTLVCGIVPAIRGTRGTLAATLAIGGRSQISGSNPLQFLLVGVQVALAVTLLADAGLLLRSFQELGRVSPGFDPRRVLTFRISLTFAETGGGAARQRTARILDGLRSVPGIESVALSATLPGVPNEYEVELKTTEDRAETSPKMIAQGRWITPEYFTALRIPILSGELCRDEPNIATAMVNRTFADLYLNGQAAIGRHLIQPANSYLRPAEIRGIVGDARETGLDHEPPPIAYWCGAALQPGMIFLIRANGDPGSLAGTIRRKMRELEPLRSVYSLTPLTSHISDAYAENRLRMILLAFFALTAISLASVGLYGTLSYAVNVRRREVAVRMALGALKGQIARQFLTQGLVVTALGCMVGLMLAAASARTLSSMLYGVSSTDTATLGGVVVIVLAVSIVASLLPAIRAARLDPMQALRED